MSKIVSFFRDLHQDNSGASFIEYTALLGVILAVGIGILASVGGWAGDTWTYLCETLVDQTAATVASSETCGAAPAAGG